MHNEDYVEPRLCSGCRGQGVIPTPDGEDAFECTVCDGSGLARAVPFYVQEPWRSAMELQWQGVYGEPDEAGQSNG